MSQALKPRNSDRFSARLVAPIHKRKRVWACVTPHRDLQLLEVLLEK